MYIRDIAFIGNFMSSLSDLPLTSNHWGTYRARVGNGRVQELIGFENDKKNFFWLVGQGGYGIQTAPALAEISADLILDKKNNFFLNKSSMYNISIERMRNEIL